MPVPDGADIGLGKPFMNQASLFGRRNMKGGDRNRFIVAVLIAAIPVMLLVACGAPQAPASLASSGDPRPVAVNVTPAKVGNISVTTSYAALVEATDLESGAPGDRAS